MEEHASATNFDSYLKNYIGDTPTLALLLDYDGTLTPIVKHPDLAVIPPETKSVLERLSKRSDVFIAVVSGRGVENVKKMVGIEGKESRNLLIYLCAYGIYAGFISEFLVAYKALKTFDIND